MFSHLFLFHLKTQQRGGSIKKIMNSEFMSTTSHTNRRLHQTIECGCDLVVMIEALQASCPGSNPGVRTSLLH
jgi:hypothetical protein